MKFATTILLLDSVLSLTTLGKESNFTYAHLLGIGKAGS
uniref:Uncharacterized protein n=1 Tax=Arundo donax TaxID=35708 RepID=A0A0A9HNG6_ARUDO